MESIESVKLATVYHRDDARIIAEQYTGPVITINKKLSARSNERLGVAYIYPKGNFCQRGEGLTPVKHNFTHFICFCDFNFPDPLTKKEPKQSPEVAELKKELSALQSKIAKLEATV